jgi:hypothetical protein
MKSRIDTKDGRAIVVIAAGEPPALEDIGKPGMVSAFFEVDAGALAALERDDWFQTCLLSGLPVVVSCDDAADASVLHEKIQRGQPR